MPTAVPSVSVILPTYNRAALLRRSIDSVLNQTWKDFELIIVDDASTDDTPSLVHGVKDDRVVYVRHTSNRGAAAARNSGIRAARGRFVAFLDSDDTWLPTKLERQMTTANRSPSLDARVVYYTQTIKDDGESRVVRPRRGKRVDEDVASYVFCANLDINTIVVLMPTALAAEFEFLEGSQTHEEVDFFMRLEAAGVQFEFLPEPLSVYHCEPRSDRMSSSTDVGPSLRWHDSVATYFSPRATRGFRAKIIAPRLAASGRKWAAINIILTALTTGSIRFNDALKYTADCVLPEGTRIRLKALLAGTPARQTPSR